MAKNEKVMIVIKRSIDIVNMMPLNPPAGGEQLQVAASSLKGSECIVDITGYQFLIFDSLRRLAERG